MRSINAEDRALPEINTEREKKEVKKEAIEDWKKIIRTRENISRSGGRI